MSANVTFAGIINVNLYICPYQVTADLMTIFDNQVAFDTTSPDAIIRTLAQENAFVAQICGPFDYGYTSINPDLATKTGGVDVIGPTQRAGSSFFTFKMTVGSAIHDQPTQGISLYCSAYTQGGMAGQVQSNFLPILGFAEFNNGYVPPDKFELTVWAIAFYTVAGPAILYSTGDAFGSFATWDGSLFDWANWSDNFQNIGVPIASTDNWAYWAPKAGPYDFPRYFQMVLSPNGGNEDAPSDGTDLPIPLLLDNATYQAAFSGGGRVHSGSRYLTSSVAVETFPGQAFTPVLLDTQTSTYYIVQFNPKTPLAAEAISDAESIDVQLDSAGVIYVLNNKVATRGQIFHTQGFDIDFNQPAVPIPQPIVLPCFNPCQSAILPTE